MIPSEWKAVRVGRAAQLNPTKTEVRRLPADTEVTFLPMEAVSEDGVIANPETRQIGDVYYGYSFFRDGDILIAKITPCFENGKRVLATDLCNGIGFGSTEFHVVRPSPEVDARYLFYVFSQSGFRELGSLEMRGAAGQQRVPAEFVKQYPLQLPPTKVQRTIAAFLDRETARIDALIERQEKLIALLEEKRQAVISRAVTKGLDPNVRMKDSGIEWLGEIPAHWEAKKAKRLIGELRSGVSVNAVDMPVSERELGVLKTSCVYTRSFRPSQNKTVLDIDEKSRLECPVTKNTIIISRMNTPDLVGASAYVDRDYPNLFLPDRLWLAVMRRQYTDYAEYIASVFSSIGFRSLIASVATGTSGSMKNIAQEDLLSTGVPVPPRSEISSINNQIRRHIERSNQTTAAIQRANLILRERRSALICAAVTGQIDVSAMEG